MAVARDSSGSEPNPAAGVEELKWFQAHQAELTPYTGQWIAVSGTSVVGSAQSASDALAQARSQRKKDPLIVFVADPATRSRHRIA